MLGHRDTPSQGQPHSVHLRRLPVLASEHCLRPPPFRRPGNGGSEELGKAPQIAGLTWGSGPPQPGGGRWLPSGPTPLTCGTGGGRGAGGSQDHLCGVLRPGPLTNLGRSVGFSPPGTHLPQAGGRNLGGIGSRLCPEAMLLPGRWYLLQLGACAAGWGGIRP